MENVYYGIKIKEYRKKQKKIEDKIKVIIKNVFPSYSHHIHTVGTWYCSKSPIGLCIYDSVEDPDLDECIFCGNPDERK